MKHPSIKISWESGDADSGVLLRDTLDLLILKAVEHGALYKGRVAISCSS